MKKKKEFSLYVENADGPIQLNLMNETTGTGRRLLGSKGSPHKEVIKAWALSKEELNTLIHEMTDVMENG